MLSQKRASPRIPRACGFFHLLAILTLSHIDPAADSDEAALDDSAKCVIMAATLVARN
jgi:hypothetical protein